ncbi:hypothetical protein TNCT_565121 [Trichonephila clavata]|uniref:Uncharacterized protein n=1 Tax=Trichonephila clavata TaxID=2740835 RepID=A0A8X6HX02_TRICU|nr:hypothetical protein TNCT_565121 [Trichonephila clavata]
MPGIGYGAPKVKATVAEKSLTNSAGTAASCCPSHRNPHWYRTVQTGDHQRWTLESPVASITSSSKHMWSCPVIIIRSSLLYQKPTTCHTPKTVLRLQIGRCSKN